MTEVHRLLIVISGVVDTAHHTLIITEEEDGETTDAVDGYEKATLLKLVHHIVPGYHIHGDVGPVGLIGRRKVSSRPRLCKGLVDGRTDKEKDQERRLLGRAAKESLFDVEKKCKTAKRSYISGSQTPNTPECC